MKRNTWTKALPVLAIIAMLSSGTMLQAEEAAAAKDATEPNTGRVSIDLGVDIATHYYFRGALQEDQGFIIQPWGEVGFSLYEGDGPINSFGLTVGVWNSFHSKQTGSVGGASAPDTWYEADMYVGVAAGLFDNWEVGLTYISYTSPNDAWNSIQEIDLSVSYDDSGLWGDSGFALNPSATLAMEIDNTLLGTDEGTYLGLSIEPSFTIIESKQYPVTLSIPVTLGLGLNDYYEDANNDNDAFGFLDVGFVLGIPLAFIPDDFGSWSLSAGVHLMILGDTNEALNTGDAFETVGTFGISMSY